MKDRRKTVAYLRVSTLRQAEEGVGLDVQKEKIKQYLNLFDKSIDEVGYYVDEGKSAKNKNRPELKRLIDDVKKGVIEEIIVYKLDRLSRSVIDTFELISLFIDNQCSLVAVMDQIDISSANGRMLVGILSIIAQWEREVNSERTTDSLRELAEQGKLPWGLAPFGYTRDENLFVKINMKQAEEIIAICKSIIETKSIKKTSEFFMDKGWTYKKISKVINAPFYRGHLVTKKYTIENHHENIITEEMYADVKKSLNLKKDLIRNRAKHNYIFQGKIICSTCNKCCNCAGTTKSNGARYNYYKCTHCGKRVSESNIFTEIKLFLIQHYSIVNNRLEIVDDYRKKIKRYTKKLEEVHHSYLVGSIDVVFYEKAYNRIKLEISNLESDIDGAVKKILKLDISKKQDLKFLICNKYDRIIICLATKRVVETHDVKRY